METNILIAVLGLYGSIFYIWYKLGKIEAQLKTLYDIIHNIKCDNNEEKIL